MPRLLKASRHVLIPGLIWALLSVAADLTLTKAVMPPGYGSSISSGEADTMQLFSIHATTIFIGVVVFMSYFFIAFRRRKADQGDARPTLHGHRAMVAWLCFSGVMIMFAAGYGSAELVGQVDPHLVVPAAKYNAVSTNQPFVIQVIGQQWQWTFRYPQYGGFESALIRIPAGRLVKFEVTSLDVIHGFWAIQLGVKLLAVPGANNIGYDYAPKPQTFDVECYQLCGLWHGYMVDRGAQAGKVLTMSAFQTWARHQEAVYKGQSKYVPGPTKTYYPSPKTYGG